MNEFTYKPRFWLVVHLSCQTATPFWLHWNDLPHPLEWEGRLQVRRSTWWTFCQPQVSQSANHAVLGAASLAEGSYNSLIDMRLGKAFLFFLSHWSNPTDPLRPVKESHDVRWKKALNAVFFFSFPSAVTVRGIQSQSPAVHLIVCFWALVASHAFLIL